MGWENDDITCDATDNLDTTDDVKSLTDDRSKKDVTGHCSEGNSSESAQ